MKFNAKLSLTVIIKLHSEWTVGPKAAVLGDCLFHLLILGFALPDGIVIVDLRSVSDLQFCGQALANRSTRVKDYIESLLMILFFSMMAWATFCSMTRATSNPYARDYGLVSFTGKANLKGRRMPKFKK